MAVDTRNTRRLAVLDDVLRISPRLADWSKVREAFDIDIFDRNLSPPDEAARHLQPYEGICLLRERMAVPRSLLEQLPKLKFVGVTGPYHRTMDLAAATELGIVVSCTVMRGPVTATSELAWAHMLALSKRLALEDRRMRNGGWQSTVGTLLEGKTLGLVGFGRVGRQMTAVARAFGMDVLAWSPNLTPEDAQSGGAVWASKEDLFRRSDFISIHVVLSERSRGLVGAADLGLMKPTACLVNTARGPIVDEAALLRMLQEGRIAGAGLDVFEHEPLAPDHPLRDLDNVVLTPHLGFSTEEVYRVFYEDTVENLEAYLAGKPIRLLNPEVLDTAQLRL
jgi:D-3-phosphoglycerate dehydrogenase